MEVIKKSFAKVNLMLRVIKKNDNGYHELQMLNKKINIFDVITIKKDKQDKIIFTNCNIDNSFLHKVLSHLKKTYNIKTNYKIEIEKHIPIGSGLGGASMDAATLIDEIFKLENINDTLENKINNFKHLGADIAYGFVDDMCIVEGEGELLFPFNASFLKPMVLVYPNIMVSTKEVFDNLDKNYSNEYSKKLKHDDIIYQLDNDDIYINDLEKSSFNLNKCLLDLKNNLSKYGKVVMSGTGSSLLVHTKEIEKIKEEYPDYLVVKVN